MITLRPYQQECIRSIPERGAYLIQLATGLGKTVIFTQMPRRGRMLIISHREELVRQPLKYFDCKTGVEMAVFPACAGVILLILAHLRAKCSFPRMRGGDPLFPRKSHRQTPFSPHARG